MSALRTVHHRCRSSLPAASLLALLVLMANSALAAGITSVTPVNVTPSSFSIAARAPGLAVVDLSVYADPGGVTNLAGLVGIEFFPLNTGNPDLLSAYERRQQQSGLRQKTKTIGLIHARVTECRPGAAYYYRLRATGTNGQEMFWPASGLLPEVITPLANSFVAQSKQLVVELPAGNVEGRIVTLSNAHAAYKLAAVVGDGAGTNQAFFNLSELVGQANESNLDLLGSQEFVVEALGGGGTGPASFYTLNFTSAFGVADASFNTWDLLTLGFGSATLRAGQSGSVPIAFTTRNGLTALSFALDLPVNRLADLVIQPLAPEIESVSLQPVSATRSVATFTPRAGELLQGTQELARLSFNTLSNQTSAFVPLVPVGFIASKPDTSRVGNASGQPGKVIIVAGDPLLDAGIATNHTRTLTLYGNSGASYQMQYAFSMTAPAEWTDWLTIPLAGLSQTFDAFSTTNQTIYFRAREASP